MQAKILAWSNKKQVGNIDYIYLLRIIIFQFDTYPSLALAMILKAIHEIWKSRFNSLVDALVSGATKNF